MQATFNSGPKSANIPGYGGSVIVKYATSGNVPNWSGNHTTFTSSGNWTCPAGVYKVNALIIGGGGAGAGAFPFGSYYGGGGGGGAGGYLWKTFISVTPGTVYSIVVGGGGSSTYYVAGGSGGYSSAFGYTATGGGGGGAGGDGSGGSNNGGGPGGAMGSPQNTTGQSMAAYSGNPYTNNSYDQYCNATGSYQTSYFIGGGGAGLKGNAQDQGNGGDGGAIGWYTGATTFTFQNQFVCAGGAGGNNGDFDQSCGNYWVQGYAPIGGGVGLQQVGWINYPNWSGATQAPSNPSLPTISGGAPGYLGGMGGGFDKSLNVAGSGYYYSNSPNANTGSGGGGGAIYPDNNWGGSHGGSGLVIINW